MTDKASLCNTVHEYPYLANTSADLRLIGAPGVMAPFIQFSSAPRVAMLNHHLPQAMIIDHPEFNKTFTGAERAFGDYVFNKSKRDGPCEILAIIHKYRGTLVSSEVCPIIYVVILVEDERTREKRLDYFTVERYFMGTNGFGWIPEIHNRNLVKVGEFLEKDTVITTSPALKGDEYGFGVNLNTVYGSFPETIEDAFAISESAARKLQTQHIERKTIVCRMDRRPLNINGDKDEPKFLPDIGSYVREDGALCAFRPVHWTTVISDTDPESLREPLPLQDEIIYVEAGAKILDLTFNINRSKLNDCYEQAVRYQVNNTKCWEDIFNIYLRYKGKYHLTPKMSTLVSDAIYRLIAHGVKVPSPEPEFAKATKNPEIEGSNGHVVDFMEVEVTYVVPRPVTNGTKLTDLAGAKGVVGTIMPDDWMPVDEFGIRADLMIDMNSPVSRNNPSQLYEVAVNRISEFVRRICAVEYKEKGSDVAFATLLDWYNDINPNYAQLIRNSYPTARERDSLVKDAIETSPKIWIPPYLDTLTPKPDNFWNALDNVGLWAKKWGVTSTPITYKSLQADGSGKEFVTEAKFAIGSKYILHLHKIPEQFAPGFAAVNHLGVPTKSSYDNRHYPVSVNPYRFGEDELRVMSMDTDIREITRFQNLLSNSPFGVTTAIKALLLSPNPTRIKRIPISNGVLAQRSAILNLFHSITTTLGFQTKTTDDVGDLLALLSELGDDAKLAESIWESNVVEGDDGSSYDDDDDEPVSKRSINKREKIQKMIVSMDTPASEIDATDDDEVVDEEDSVLEVEGTE